MGNLQWTIKVGMKKESGQVLMLLILIMTVALATGLSIIQKSLSDISTASKVEQSSRAFSAAEAGIEKALQGASDTSVDFSGNNSKATVNDQNNLPAIPANGGQDPLEFPPLAKEDVVQVGLAELNSTSNPPDERYKQDSLDIYWGNSSQDKAAIELSLVYYKSGIGYQSQKWYFDFSTRSASNNFTTANCGGFTLGQNNYQCKETLDFSILPNNSRLILLRARLLYNSSSQPFAVKATGTCGADCSLPSQARKIYSTGVSGETQRKVSVFQGGKLVPPYFDYAIFSAGDIDK